MIKHLKIYLEKNKKTYDFFRKLYRLPGVFFNVIKYFSINNIKAYFYPLRYPEYPGYVTSVTKRGISGIATDGGNEKPLKVDLVVDGVVINSTYASQKVLFPTKYKGEFIGFYFPMRYVWNHISVEQRLEIRAGEKSLKMYPGKGRSIPVKYLSAKVDKNILELINQGEIITKFGKIQGHRNKKQKWLSKVSESYLILNELFEKEAKKSLFYILRDNAWICQG